MKSLSFIESNMKSVWCIIFFVNVSISLSLSQSISDANHQIVQNGILNFGVKLNSVLLKNNADNKNILFSPYNLYTALALVHLGSNGTTRDEISNILGIPNTFSPKSLHEVLQNFSSVVRSSFEFSEFQNGTEVNVKAADLILANGIFVQKEFKLKKSYVEDVQLFHNSEVFNVDFAGKSEETKDTINKYIANKTENKIPRLFEQSLSQDTLMILTSCLCFKSIWEEKFFRKLTKADTFYAEKGNVTVHMMHNLIATPYANIPSLGVEVVNLKFMDKAFSMFIVMPYKNHSLEKYLHNMTTDNINTIIDQANTQNIAQVYIKMPKTAIEWSKSVKNELIQLGLKADILNSPDLSNMVERGNAEIDDLSHSTGIKINEDGTEASATSTVKVVLKISSNRNRQATFHVNRPFFFFLYNHNVNTVLFFGTVFDPKKS